MPSGATVSAAAPDGYFTVSSSSLGDVSLFVVQVSSADAVAQVTVSAPAGYTAALGAPPGRSMGFVSAGLSDVPGTTSSSASAELVADDPVRHVGTPQAEACAPGRHAAVWKAALSVLGQSFALAIYVDPSPAGGVVLRYCPLWPSPVLAAGVTAHRVALFVEDVFARPAAPGRYAWSALVSPPRGDLTPDASRTFELRAVEPVPHTLTLRAGHDAKRKTVALSGKLTAAGQPESGAEILFTADTSSFEETTFFGPVTTDAAGEFTITRRIDVTTQFSASVELPDTPCSAPSAAPAGCVRETVASPPSASTIVRVRTPLDPKLVVRVKDQALARRASLKLADLPEGWQPFDSFSFLACRAFAPRLSDLTATGDVESPIFAISTSSEGAAVASRATVFVTEAQARTAFARTARLGLARCIADEVKAVDGASVLQLGSIPFASLGAETRAFRIVYSVDQFVANLDFVSFRKGRVVVHLGFASATQPLLIAEELARKVAARARTR